MRVSPGCVPAGTLGEEAIGVRGRLEVTVRAAARAKDLDSLFPIQGRHGDRAPFRFGLASGVRVGSAPFEAHSRKNGAGIKVRVRVRVGVGVRVNPKKIGARDEGLKLGGVHA